MATKKRRHKTFKTEEGIYQTSCRESVQIEEAILNLSRSGFLIFRVQLRIEVYLSLPNKRLDRFDFLF